jgi:ribosome biogenesis protein UTP30
MAPPSVDVASKVSAAQVAKAVHALKKHLEKVRSEAKTQLFDEDGGDETFSVLVSTRKTPQKGSNKLVPIRVPHPLLDLKTAEICLIVKDKEGEGHKEAKKKVAEMEKCGVAKVLGISKLRNNYKPHEAKRQLCDSYDLFLADARVIPVLPKLLGKSFFVKKKQPVPVDLTKQDWPKQVRKAASATYVHVGAGTCVHVKVAKARFSVEDVVENAMAAIAGVVEIIPRKWANVQSVYMKTNESVALPLYNATPTLPEEEAVAAAAAADPDPGANAAGKEKGKEARGEKTAAAKRPAGEKATKQEPAKKAKKK